MLMRINAIKEFYNILAGQTREFPRNLCFKHINVYHINEKNIENSDVSTMEALLLKIPEGKVCIQNFCYDLGVENINLVGIFFNPECESFTRCYVLYQKNEDLIIMDYNLYCGMLYSVECITDYSFKPECIEKLQDETKKAILKIVRGVNKQDFAVTIHKSNFI